MSKEIALITIHGMGDTKNDYYEELKEKLIKKLKDDWNKISFQNVYYAPILQKPQEDLWDSMRTNKNNDLDFTKLRKFVLYGFGDAGSMEYSSCHDETTYIEVQAEIQRALKAAYADLDEQSDKEVIIIAQSLGGQVISNYLWDAEKDKKIFKNMDDNSETNFLKLKSLRKLITTGCNIPLFVSGLKKRECFEAPYENFSWDNYYDPDDILGWPLQQLSDGHNLLVKDHHINVGVFTSSTPFSHMFYWTDKDVIKPLVKEIQKMLK